MRRRCIPYLIDCLHRGIDCRVETDRIFGTCNIQIDRARQTDRIDPKSGHRLRTSVRAVAANNNQTVDAVSAADLRALFLSGFGLKFQTTCGSQNRTALLDGIRNAAGIHIYDFFI